MNVQSPFGENGQSGRVIREILVEAAEAAVEGDRNGARGFPLTADVAPHRVLVPTRRHSHVVDGQVKDVLADDDAVVFRREFDEVSLFGIFGAAVPN